MQQWTQHILYRRSPGGPVPRRRRAVGIILRPTSYTLEPPPPPPFPVTPAVETPTEAVDAKRV